MHDTVATWLASFGLRLELVDGFVAGLTVLLLLAVSWVSFLISRRFVVSLAENAVRRTSNEWDDTLHSCGFFRRLALLLPLVILYVGADLLFPAGTLVAELLKRLALTLLVLLSVLLLDALLAAIRETYSRSMVGSRKPIRGYLDAIKIVAYLMAGIFMISTMTKTSPWGIFSVLGGATVVLMLVFKDTILGFVASIQLAGHDMVRVGDWIEMPTYGADGDVIDVSIHTVKVRNWDKTVTTIPTYGLVSNSFKNWRGMSESGGRRIKRSLLIDMHSIRFCDQPLLQRLSRIELLREYLTGKERELLEYNRAHGVDTSDSINGRRQTNIGVFRAYIVAYLRNNPMIHQQMTFLVRHLQPTPQGLPIEIYVFSNDQVWANYEAIQADIFDHLLAATPEFGLRVFQNPSGFDLQTLAQTLSD